MGDRERERGRAGAAAAEEGKVARQWQDFAHRQEGLQEQAARRRRWLQEQKELERKVSLAQKYAQANELFQKGEYYPAVRAYSEALIIDPENQFAQTGIREAYNKLKEKEAATKVQAMVRGRRAQQGLYKKEEDDDQVAGFSSRATGERGAGREAEGGDEGAGYGTRATGAAESYKKEEDDDQVAGFSSWATGERSWQRSGGRRRRCKLCVAGERRGGSRSGSRRWRGGSRRWRGGSRAGHAQRRCWQ